MQKKVSALKTPSRVSKGTRAISTTEQVEHTLAHSTLQLLFLARRVGAMDPATLSTIAALAFSTEART